MSVVGTVHTRTCPKNKADFREYRGEILLWGGGGDFLVTRRINASLPRIYSSFPSREFLPFSLGNL
jgi:hypothetical protein